MVVSAPPFGHQPSESSAACVIGASHDTLPSRSKRVSRLSQLPARPATHHLPRSEQACLQRLGGSGAAEGIGAATDADGAGADAGVRARFAAPSATAAMMPAA